MKILVVDDTSDLRSSLVELLSLLGHTSVEASSGEECLEVLSREMVDAVILDYTMPGMSGLETLSVIRKRFGAVRVIVSSGGFMDGLSGDVETLPKPYTIAMLDQALGKVV